MAITGLIFDNQVPTAKGLRGAFHSAISDGIISGCDITYAGLNVTIGSGLVHASGGLFQIVGSEVVRLNTTSGFARIKAVIDISQTATELSFDQVSFVADYADSANGFVDLVQDDINTGNGPIYESEFCVVEVTNSVITRIVRTAIAAPKIQYGTELPADAPEGTIFLLEV